MVAIETTEAIAEELKREDKCGRFVIRSAG